MGGTGIIGGLQVLGVTQLNDSYPNVKYKLALLKDLMSTNYAELVVPIDKANTAGTIIPSVLAGKAGFAWRMLRGHLRVFTHSMRHRADSIYVCYPGVFIAAWLGLPLVRSRYQYLYLDGFISLYDTVVCDRKILKAGSLLARLLFKLERRAFAAATSVIVDTPENARYYSTLFGLPESRFCPIPLSIPGLELPAATPNETAVNSLRCVFVGTLVPLQGVGTVVDAIEQLAGEPGIEFVFVGDGQDAAYLQEFMMRTQASNVTWHRGHYSTEFVVQQLAEADLCLGIFGEGSKTQRVLPYKIYYYLALGLPVLTAATATTERIDSECRGKGETVPLTLVPAGNAGALADALLQFRDNPGKLSSLGQAGANYFRRVLAPAVIEQSMDALLTPGSNNKPVPTRVNTAAVVVSYHPEESFAQNLASLGSQFAAVFWVDNTPTPQSRRLESSANAVHYLPQGENIGLAAALNSGCGAALAAGFDWVVTFDQDSQVVDDFLHQQIRLWGMSGGSASLLGCNYADTGAARFKEGDYVIACRTVITSGCLMNLSRLGEFPADYFIDGVDHEVCLRARANGLVVARHGRVLMQHRIGERAAGNRLLPYVHSPLRKYYSMRNGVRNIIHFAASDPMWAARKSASLAWEVVVAMLLEADKWSRFKAQLRGLNHGLRGRMGVAPDDLAS